jgi:hypothetical protein
MVNEHPCRLHLKSWCAQEHTIVESFSMPSFLLFIFLERRKISTSIKKGNM